MQIIRRNISATLATLAVIAFAGPPASLDSACAQAGGRQVPFHSAPNHRIASLRPVYNLQPNEHPVMPALRWARAGVRYIDSIKDYSCTFAKRERVNGVLTPYKYMRLKVRHRPFSVYVYFESPSNERGKEAIYVEGRDNGKVMAHGVGFVERWVGAVALDPRGRRAMAGNSHPITEIGILNMTSRLIKAGENDCQFGECEVKFIHGAKVNGRSCTCMQFVHPVPRREFRFHLVRVFVDDALNLPIRFETYDWPKQRGGAPVLTGEYTYMNLKLNNGFTDRDFDIRNQSYGFCK